MNADNLVVLNGRLTKEVDLRFSQNGTAVANFTVAVNRSRREQNGERKADFHNCVAFYKTAEIIADNFQKGSMIGIVGELQDNNYEKDGVKHYNKQIVVDAFGFRESKSAQNNVGQAQNNSHPSIPGIDERGFNTSDPFSGSQPIDIADSDLPF